MQTAFVFGHKKPDTDSVCASISLSYLKNALGMNTQPRVLGNINNETKFVLNYFGVNEPTYLNDVKVQIRNMNYIKKEQQIFMFEIIYNVYNILQNKKM